MIKKLLPYLILIILVFWHIYTLKDYPAYFADDGTLASRVEAVIEKGTPDSVLENDVVKLIKDGSKLVGWHTYFIYAIPRLITGQNNLITIRSTNIIFITLILTLTYLISLKIKGREVGIFAIILLGTSQIFAFSSHIARPDLISAAYCLLSLYLTIIAKKDQFFHGFIAGSLLIFAFDSHPRASLYYIIIGIFYLQKYGAQIFSTKNFWGFILGFVSFGLPFYIFLYAPYSESRLLFNKVTVANSRSLPILSMDLNAFYICLKQIYDLLLVENFIYLTLFLELFLALLFNKNKQFTWLIWSTVLATISIMRNFYFYNSVIVFPIFMIAVASFLHRLQFSKNSRILVLLILFLTSFRSLSNVYAVQKADCNIEFERNASEIAKYLSIENKILTVDVYWFFFQNHQMASWVQLNYLRRYFNFSLEDAFKYLKPDYFIADDAFFYFISSKSTEFDSYNNMMINKEEFENVIKKYGSIVYENKDRCENTTYLYKFSW